MTRQCSDRFIVVFAVCLVVLAGCAPAMTPQLTGRQASVSSEAPLPVRLVDAAFRHLRVFQKIADDNGGHRAGAGYTASAEYAAETLAEAGYDVTRREDPVPGQPAGEKASNLVAAWPGSESAGPVVLIGAHLDSVPQGPGINDNASGVALALAVAQERARHGSAEGISIGLWGGEEKGLFGSRGYTQALGRQVLRERFAAYINLDMVASPNGIVGLYGAEAVTKVLAKALGERPYVMTDLTGLIDQTLFQAAGIASGGIYTGADEKLSTDDVKLFGGEAGRAHDPCYHQRCDTLGHLDTGPVRERMTSIAEAVWNGADELLKSR